MICRPRGTSRPRKRSSTLPRPTPPITTDPKPDVMSTSSLVVSAVLRIGLWRCCRTPPRRRGYGDLVFRVCRVLCVGRVGGFAASGGARRRVCRCLARGAGARPRRWCLAVVLAAVLVGSGCEWPLWLSDDPVVVATLGGGSIRGRPPNVVPDGVGGGVLVDRVYVEARARLGGGGSVEVGARVNATELWWQPDRRLFDYPNATVGEWWTSSPIGSAGGGVSGVRMRARRLDGGAIEFALLSPGGVEVIPRAPELVYEELTAERWVEFPRNRGGFG